jgi:misacylated tRNA(Ala) deacylase
MMDPLCLTHSTKICANQDSSDPMTTTQLYLQYAYQRDCIARVTKIDQRGIQLDQTPFYAMGGGQPGDRGFFQMSNGARIDITGTIRDRDSGEIIHVLPDTTSHTLKPGDELRAEIDWALRYRHMRCHSCLHLLCSLIPYPVTGGSVRADSGRLDFDIPDPILDKEQLTVKLQALIDLNRTITIQAISVEELRHKPELVRTLQVAPPMIEGQPVRLVHIDGIDLQPCGGSHLKSTGEIGRAWITRIEKKGKQNRRVEIALA